VGAGGGRGGGGGGVAGGGWGEGGGWWGLVGGGGGDGGSGGGGEEGLIGGGGELCGSSDGPFGRGRGELVVGSGNWADAALAVGAQLQAGESVRRKCKRVAAELRRRDAAIAS